LPSYPPAPPPSPPVPPTTSRSCSKLPSYNTLEQIRAGNMGHVAIDIDHHLHDIGSLNGYAYPSPASQLLPAPSSVPER